MLWLCLCLQLHCHCPHGSVVDVCPFCALQFCQAKHKDVTMAVLHELYSYLSVQAGECQHIPTLQSLQELPLPAPAHCSPTLEGVLEQAVPFEEFRGRQGVGKQGKVGLFLFKVVLG